MAKNQSMDGMPSDSEFVEWVKSGEESNIKKAVEILQNNAELNYRIRVRCRDALERRQMLYPDQAFYMADAEHDVLLWIFERAFSKVTLPVTILERGRKAGGPFDPTKGRLISWLVQQAYFHLLDWLKKQAKEIQHTKQSQEFDEVLQTQGDDRHAEHSEQSQENRLRQLKLKLRDAFATLSPMRRACMIVQYIDDVNGEILNHDDILCLWKVRSKSQKKNLEKLKTQFKAPQANKKTAVKRSKKVEIELTPGEEEIIRDELQKLWQRVADRVLLAEDVKEEEGPVGQRKHEIKASLIEQSLRFHRQRRDSSRKQLKHSGLTEDFLDALEEQAKEMTLGQITLTYSNKWSDERQFVESSKRIGKLERQYANAIDTLKKSSLRFHSLVKSLSSLTLQLMPFPAH